MGEATETPTTRWRRTVSWGLQLKLYERDSEDNWKVFGDKTVAFFSLIRLNDLFGKLTTQHVSSQQQAVEQRLQGYSKSCGSAGQSQSPESETI